MKTATNGDRSRRIHLALLSSLVSISLIAGIYVARFHYFVRHLKGYEEVASADYRPPVFPKLTDREVVNLGWAHSVSNHPDSSYINYPAEKKPGVIRIGTFGDSNTAGSEVARSHDYPSFLQRHFAEAGYVNVEVINFGVGSYGVHQAYLMWKTLGEKFDLDIVVLMPFKFHKKRDRTFIMGGRSYLGVHARYVLSNGGVELIEVLGENRLESSERYFSMIPDRRYLRYDTKAPAFIRALLPGGRRVAANPFYYDAGMSRRNEIGSTYTLLLTKWAEEANALVVTTLPGGFFEELSTHLASTPIQMLQSRVEKSNGSNLYRAPITHWSALGQELRGEELFSYLTGAANPSPRRLQVRVAKGRERTPVVLKPLSEYAGVSVNIGDAPVAVFVLERSRGNSADLGKEMAFAENETVSLLQGVGREVPFIPVQFPLIDGAKVTLSFRVDREPVELPIGKVETGSGILGRIELDDSEAGETFGREGANWSLRIEDGNYLERMFIESTGTIGTVVVRIEDQDVIRSKPSRSADEARGTPVAFNSQLVEPFAYLRAAEGQYVDIDTIEARRGPLELTLTGDGGETIRVPMYLDYELVTGESSPFDAPYPNPVVARGAAVQ